MLQLENYRGSKLGINDENLPWPYLSVTEYQLYDYIL